MEGWLCSDTGGRFRAATLSFDRTALATSPFDGFELDKQTVPRMMFPNQRLWSLGLDLASECSEPGQLTPLYRDSVVSLMLIELLRSGTGRRKTGRLTQAQLNCVLDCIEHSPIDRLRLSELAALVGLSPSHFSQAFRKSTGMPPYRWQLSSRVRKAQALLLEGKLSVAEAALATGFVDQSHFTRTFRRFTGATPSAWLRDKV
jgi:AraC family transcriptional regulator